MTAGKDHDANVDVVQAFLMAVLDEAEANPSFAARLATAVTGAGGTTRTREPGQRRHRRKPGVVDPFDVHRQDGEAQLRARLAALDAEQLKDIVAEHGMDRTKLAMRWKSTDRLVNLIVETVGTRARKGDAFRQQSDAGGTTGSGQPSSTATSLQE